MLVKRLTPALLHEFVQSDEYKQLPNIPISRHRAMSHINNPRLDDSDIIMYLAYDDTQLIAYRGILADWFFIDGKPVKFGWLSCNWVLPSLRRQGIASQLLDLAYADWGNRLMFTNYAPESKAVYDKSGAFGLLRSNIGLRCFLRFSITEILTRKKPALKKISFLFKIVDAALNIPNDLFNSHKISKQSTHDIKFEWITHFDKELTGFIEQRNENLFTHRTVNELQWILKYPWLLTAPVDDNYNYRYYFSATAKRFHLLCAKIYDQENHLQGFMMLGINGDKAYIPYFFGSDEIAKKAVKIIFRVLVELKIDYFTVFNPAIVAAIKQRNPFWYLRRFERNYLATKSLLNTISDSGFLGFQDGDGDPAFTG